MKTVLKYVDCVKLSIEFIIGSNAKENHEIIDNANPDDIWFHISDRPSCHVICKLPQDIVVNKKEWLKIAKQGAVVCKENSGYKKEKNVTIDYAEIRNVTKLEKPGAVTIANGKSIII
jgi:predicted ribosome quality control (RQC) complex YloA/Tae2 family protein